MEQNKVWLAILFIGISIITSYQVKGLCTCVNPVYVDKPTNIYQCYPKSVFLNQVTANFNKIKSKLDSQPECSVALAYYRSRLDILKSLILDIINAYYECKDPDCSGAIKKAVGALAAEKNPFSEYTYCAATLFSPTCARLIFEVRPLAFSCGENIITAMVACAALKLLETPNTISLLELLVSNVLGPLLSTFDCNCVDISTRPLPLNATDCFSPKFIDALREFHASNYKRIRDIYKNACASCEYGDVKSSYDRMEIDGEKFINILTGPNRTFAAIKQANAEYRINTLYGYVYTIRANIQANDKDCYFPVRQARNNPIADNDWLITVVETCIGYVDSQNSVCLDYPA